MSSTTTQHGSRFHFPFVVDFEYESLPSTFHTKAGSSSFQTSHFAEPVSIVNDMVGHSNSLIITSLLCMLFSTALTSLVLSWFKSVEGRTGSLVSYRIKAEHQQMPNDLSY